MEAALGKGKDVVEDLSPNGVDHPLGVGLCEGERARGEDVPAVSATATRSGEVRPRGGTR
jgi:hypothetical protein